MSTFGDQYFRDLAPRERRYDVRVSDQLVFCVFPNGVKAWVYLYDADGHVRRRTIGLFPDMGYEAALRALDPNRRIAALEASEQRRDRSSPNPLEVILERVREKVTLRDVIAAGGTAVVAFTAFVLIGGRDGSPSGPPSATVPATPVQRNVAETTEPEDAGPAELAGTGQTGPTAGAGRIDDAGESGVAGAAAPEASPTVAESALPGAATEAPAADGALPTGEVAAAEPPAPGADRDAPGREEGGGSSVVDSRSDVPPTDPATTDPATTDPAPTVAAAEPPVDAGDAGIEPESMADDALAADPDEPPAAGDRIAADDPADIEAEPAVPDETRGDETLTADADEPAAQSGVVAREADPGLTLAEAAAPATLEPAGTAATPAPPEASTIVEPQEAGAEETATLEPGETATAEPAETTAGSPGGMTDDDSRAAPSVAGAPVADQDASVLVENRAPVSTAAGYVERALLAGRIVDGEPVEPLPQSFALAPDGSRTVCFFMEVDEDAGAVVVHRWIRDGVIAAEIPLEAGEDPQGRIFSSRRVGAGDLGDWRIDALSPDGQLIASTSFTVVAPADAAARLADEQPAE